MATAFIYLFFLTLVCRCFLCLAFFSLDFPFFLFSIFFRVLFIMAFSCAEDIVESMFTQIQELHRLYCHARDEALKCDEIARQAEEKLKDAELERVCSSFWSNWVDCSFPALLFPFVFFIFGCLTILILIILHSDLLSRVGSYDF